MINEIKSKNSYTGWIDGKTIRTSGNIGSVVDFTEQTASNYSYQIIPCLAGSEFTLTLQGATYARAWCFVDKDDKIVSHADVNVTVTNFQIVAPCDGKLIVNSHRQSLNPSVTGVCRCDKIQHKDGEVRKVYCNEVLGGWTGNYIRTGGDIGTKVSDVTSTNHNHIKVRCQVGDKFYVRANGGDAPRAWAFTDDDDVLVAHSNANVSLNYAEVVSPCDGWFIANNIPNTQPNPSVKKLSKIWYPHGLVDIGANQSFSFTHTGKFLTTNGPIGGVVEFTEATDAKWGYCIVSVKKGDTFTLTCNGGAAPRAWCFTNNQRKIVSNAEAGAICTALSLTASCDGYLIVQNNFVDASENPSLVRTNAHTYPTVKIGTREWLGANLDETLGKIQTDEFYYNNDKFTYGKYGKLYKWTTLCSASETHSDALAGILPTGWRLAKKADFDNLVALDSTGSLFRDENFSNGSNNSNMSLIAGGYNTGSAFGGNGTEAFIRASTTSSASSAYRLCVKGNMFDDGGVSMDWSGNVRLVRDHLPTPTYTLPRTTFTGQAGQLVNTNQKLLMPTGTSGAMDNWTLFYNCIENNCTNSGRLLDVLGGYENASGQAIIGSGDSSGKFGCSNAIGSTWYPMLTGATGKIAIRRSTSKDYIQYSLDGVTWVNTGIQVASLYGVVSGRTSLTFGGWADNSKLGAGTISATLWDTALDDVSSMFV